MEVLSDDGHIEEEKTFFPIIVTRRVFFMNVFNGRTRDQNSVKHLSMKITLTHHSISSELDI